MLEKNIKWKQFQSELQSYKKIYCEKESPDFGNEHKKKKLNIEKESLSLTEEFYIKMAPQSISKKKIDKNLLIFDL